MAFRSDDQARSLREQALSRSLCAVETQLRELEPRRQTLAEELATVRREVRAERHRAVLPILNRIQLRTPCKQIWRKMKGDDRVRFCGRCQSDVYNLTAMTAIEAAQLIEKTPDACVRFQRRPDDTIVFGNCKERLRRDANVSRFFIVAALVVAVVTFLASWGSRDDDSYSLGGLSHEPAPPSPFDW